MIDQSHFECFIFFNVSEYKSLFGTTEKWFNLTEDVSKISYQMSRSMHFISSLYITLHDWTEKINFFIRLMSSYSTHPGLGDVTP